MSVGKRTVDWTMGQTTVQSDSWTIRYKLQMDNQCQTPNIDVSDKNAICKCPVMPSSLDTQSCSQLVTGLQSTASKMTYE